MIPTARALKRKSSVVWHTMSLLGLAMLHLCAINSNWAIKINSPPPFYLMLLFKAHISVLTHSWWVTSFSSSLLIFVYQTRPELQLLSAVTRHPRSSESSLPHPCLKNSARGLRTGYKCEYSGESILHLLRISSHPLLVILETILAMFVSLCQGHPVLDPHWRHLKCQSPKWFWAQVFL